MGIKTAAVQCGTICIGVLLAAFSAVSIGDGAAADLEAGGVNLGKDSLGCRRDVDATFPKEKQPENSPGC